jgi:cytochrome c553
MIAGGQQTDRIWIKWGIGLTAVLFLLTAVIGLVILPGLQPWAGIDGLWDSICSAAGLAREKSAATPVSADASASKVPVSSSLLGQSTPESIGRGATLGQQCAICHGPTGISRADAPNLSGQYAIAIYKQLRDFKSGARVNVVMSPFGAQMSDQNMIDVANYYAYLPRIAGDHADTNAALPRIVINGAPMRGIAPCGSCHGGLDNKAGSPWLEGQPYAYLHAQLSAFQSAQRHNDVNQLMRNIARDMTPEEIEQAARYYAAQPAEQPLQ